MTTTVKHFNELTIEELWQIYEIRSKVFVVEQNCVYQDVDKYDKQAYHVMVGDESGLQGYARVLPAHTTFDEISIGRVISLKRRTGLGTEVVKMAIQTAREKFNAGKIVIEAQVYAVTLYEKLGFFAFGKEFLEDGIPHIKMQWENN